jgi:hypothetical protein
MVGLSAYGPSSPRGRAPIHRLFERAVHIDDVAQRTTVNAVRAWLDTRHVCRPRHATNSRVIATAMTFRWLAPLCTGKHALRPVRHMSACTAPHRTAPLSPSPCPTLRWRPSPYTAGPCWPFLSGSRPPAWYKLPPGLRLSAANSLAQYARVVSAEGVRAEISSKQSRSCSACATMGQWSRAVPMR